MRLSRLAVLVAVALLTVTMPSAAVGAATAPPRITTVGGSIVPGPSPAATLQLVGDSTVDRGLRVSIGNGIVYVKDRTTIRAIDPDTGVERVVVGDGSDVGFPDRGPGRAGGGDLLNMAAAPDGKIFFAVNAFPFELREYDPATGDQALVARVRWPGPDAVDSTDRVLHIVNQCQVEALDPATLVSTVIAGGTCGGGAVNGQTALTATFDRVSGVTVLPTGDLVVLDSSATGQAVWDVPLTGPISRLAASPQLQRFLAVSASPSGAVYVEALTPSAISPEQILAVGRSGSLTAVAGGGTQVPIDGLPATAARLSLGQFAGGVDGVYFFDFEYHPLETVPLRFVGSAGTLSTTIGGLGVFGDGGPALAAQLVPQSMAADNGGIDVLQGTGTSVEVRRLKGGTVTALGPLPPGYYRAAATDRVGGVYAADYLTDTILHFGADHRVTHVINTPGDVFALAVDGLGNLDYLVQLATGSLLIRHDKATGREITLYDDSLHPGQILDGGLAAGGLGQVYVTASSPVDQLAQVDEVVAPEVAVPLTLSGGYSGDGGPAILARVTPSEIGTDDAGDVFILDEDHNVVRMINRSGIITTIAGTGEAGFAPDGFGPSTPLDRVAHMSVAPNGTAYIFERFRIRAITGAADTPLVP